MEDRTVEGPPMGHSRVQETEVKGDNADTFYRKGKKEDPYQKPDDTGGGFKSKPACKEHALTEADPLPHQEKKGRGGCHDAQASQLDQKQHNALGCQ